MNTKLFLAGFFGLTLLAAFPAVLADTVAGTPDATVRYNPNKVGDAVSSLPLLNEVTPNTSARYYVYLCSAGWCGPCNREMPCVVELYKEMKKSGLVELILVDFDRSETDAQAFIAKYGVDFPATMNGNRSQLPGFRDPRGIPSAIIVDAAGTVLVQDHGSIVRRWRDIITEYEKKKDLPLSFPEELTLTYSPEHSYAEVDAAGEADASTGTSVSKSLRKIKWFNGKPAKKAKFYIYLQSASWCGPCRAEMPEIVEQYKEMKKDGRVELVLLGGDRTLGEAKAFLKDNKAKFPGTMRNARGVPELPGAGSLPNYFPAAVIVREDGTVITSGHGSLIKEWRKYTIDAERAEETEESTSND